MKIWQRYLLRRLTTSFLFLLLLLFAIYVLLDLSIHGARFLGESRTQLFDLLLYYLRHFAIHLDLFLPLAFLLATLKTLLSLSNHLELVALQTAGLSNKKLLIPFFLFATFLALIGYANHEWISPNAGIAADTFRISYSKSKRKKLQQEYVQSIALQDGSEIVYQRYNPQTKEFFDLFWIRSPSDIWTMKTLSNNSDCAVGRFVDHLIRNSTGLFEKTESFESKELPDIRLQREVVQHPISNEHLPISTLFREASLATAEQAGAKTHLHRKLALPLCPLLTLFVIAPFVMQFSRTKRGFILVSLSLFGFMVVMTLFESLTILGENRVLAPEIAMWSPFLAIFGMSYRKFLNA